MIKFKTSAVFSTLAIVAFGAYLCLATATPVKSESPKQTVQSVSAVNKAEAITPKIDYSKYAKGAIHLQKYAEESKIRSIILVQQSKESVSKATLTLLVKGDKTPVWAEMLSVKAYLGKNGIDKVREGDKKTPSGDFGIITAFGIADNPGTTLPYLKVNDTMYCCDNREYYNKIIDVNKVKHSCTGERLIRYNPQYKYAVFLDYNKECEFGKGSAIFLHCVGSYDYTLGCISVAETDMIKILKTIDLNTRICIY